MRLADGAIVWKDQIFPVDRKGFDFNSGPLFATNKDGTYLG
jgi:hypothetical protein